MRKTKFLGRIFSGSAAAAALLCLSLPVQAADEPKEYNNFEFTPFVGYIAGGEVKEFQVTVRIWFALEGEGE